VCGERGQKLPRKREVLITEFPKRTNFETLAERGGGENNPKKF
jgi:hypothetical protein